MYRSRNQFLARVLFWLVAEILLNCLGLDNMADYSEFIFEKHYYRYCQLMQVNTNFEKSSYRLGSGEVGKWGSRDTC